MIARLRGLIDAKGEDHVVLDVQGVGYLVHCSPRVLQALPGRGEAAALHVETQMREDQIRLYGFLGEAERDWFRLLQSVQGVGARVALAIGGALGADELAAAVAAQDRAALSRAPGVGAKLAARIVAELKDRAPASGAPLAGLSEASGAGAPQGGAAADALSALVNLGYARAQASSAVAASLKALGPEAGAGELIRRGLKELAQNLS
ncbi:Holliday junction branch migration protein RuvA [Methylocella sp.]|uniref:Holliday junction branch migration protein RuvA n=1 Tax=Methylocella sp. TaxID=1978226 RepID=UPI0035B0AB74